MLNWIIQSLKIKAKNTPLCTSDPRISPEDFDPDALKVIYRLQQHGHKAYIVGGAIRDRLLGLTPKDCDVATSARPNEIRQLFRNAFIIGRRFKLVHVRFRMNKVIETATFRGHHGEDEGAPVTHDNVFGTEEDDAFRRDFTINALFYDPSKNQIIDYVGGLRDIEERKIRCIGDPDVRLIEDPVRILRAIKFAAKFNLRMAKNLDKAIHKLKHNIKLSSERRLFEEFLKILRLGIFEAFVKQAEEYSFLNHYLPFFKSYLTKDSDTALKIARACDHYAIQKPNEPHFLFALLVWPRVKEKFIATRDIQKAMHLTFAELNHILPVSRQDKVRIRFILQLLPRFDYLMDTPVRKRRALVRKFTHAPFFREALELYRSIETIEKGDNPGYRYWIEIINRPVDNRVPANTKPAAPPALAPDHPQGHHQPILRRQIPMEDKDEYQ